MKIDIVLGILITIEQFRTGKTCMQIRKSDRQFDDLRTLSFASFTA
jgi:hypothetical protein